MSEVTVTPPRSRHSPCVGICQLDEVRGICIGCARTGDEIGRWSGMSEAQRDAVWAVLPARHEALSITMRLLPWTIDEVAAWAAGTLEKRLGAWVIGAPGADAVFPCGERRGLHVERTATYITAVADDSAFRLELHDKIRAFEFGKGGPIVLGLPKARGALDAAAVFADLGTDGAALRTQDRAQRLYDMGLGRRASRFCFRTTDADLMAQLAAYHGQTWTTVMYDKGMDILAVQPHRVVESKLARIEVYSPIPGVGETAPGAYTRLSPGLVKAGEEGPASLALPEYALPLAVFYPGGI